MVAFLRCLRPPGLACALGLISLCAGPSPAFGQAGAPAVQWERTVGSLYDDYGLAVPTADGGCLLAGSARGGVSGDKTAAGCLAGSDYWVVKLSAGGAVQWQQAVGSHGTNRLSGAVQTADGGFVLAGTNGEPASAGGGVGCAKTQPNRGQRGIWVVKLSGAGALLWERSFSTPGSGNVPQATAGRGSDAASGVAAAPDGGVLVVGHSDGPAAGDKSEPTRGYADYWVLRLGPGGALLWQRTLGSPEQDLAGAVAATADGGWLVAGHSYPATLPVGSGAGGEKSEPSRGGADLWVLKLDGAGAVQWDRTCGGPGDETIGGVAATADGGCLLAGLADGPAGGDRAQPSRGDYSGWAVKLGPGGARQWERVCGGPGTGGFGGQGADDFQAVAATADGGALLLGTTLSDAGADVSQPRRAADDYWALKLDAAGGRQWDRRLGGLSGPQGRGGSQLAGGGLTADGGAVLGGRSNALAGYEKSQPGPGTPPGIPPGPGTPQGYDYWVVKLAPLALAAAPAAASAASVAVWPVPAGAGQALQVRWGGGGAAGAAGLALLDGLGRAVWAGAGAGGAAAVPLAGRAPGHYWLRITPAGGLPATRAVAVW